MKIDRGDLDVKLHLVNLGMEKRRLLRYGIDYNTKGRGQYRLKHLVGLYWVEATEWMSMTHLWYFLDGMLTLMIEQGD